MTYRSTLERVRWSMILEDQDPGEKWVEQKMSEKVTDLINGINDALQAGDIAAFNAHLSELVDVSPEDAQDVMMILGHLVVLS